MAYSLAAFVIRSEVAGQAIKQLTSAVAVPLAQDFSLIPLTPNFIAELDSAYRSGAEFDFEDLSPLAPCAAEWAELASRLSQIAFIQVEFFGGLGIQAAIGWQAGQVAFGPLQAQNAINEVLHWLGIIPGEQADEFDALQLGRYRSTQDWTKG